MSYQKKAYKSKSILNELFSHYTANFSREIEVIKGQIVQNRKVFKNHFNIASEASYICILSGQKLIENAINGPFWRVFRKPEACGQTVLPDKSVSIGPKNWWKMPKLKIKSNATF